MQPPASVSCLARNDAVQVTYSKAVVAAFIVALLSACSPARQIDKRSERLHHDLLGKWEVNKRWVQPGNNLVRDRGLPTGSIIFYPNSCFMYRNKHGRYSGNWEVSTSVNWTEPSAEGSHTSQLYGTHTVSLWFNGDMPVYQPGVTMEMVYARKKRMKFLEGYTVVNIFKR